MTGILEEFIQSGVEPFPDNAYGPGYRCSAELTDRTQLPCVIVRRRKHIVDLAARRLEEEKAGGKVLRHTADPYREMLSHFVTLGNRINHYDVKKIAVTRYAIPLPLLAQIKSETIMSWTGFVLEMNDGRRFAFGTSFSFEFFDLPDGYGFEEVASVHNHSYLDQDGNVRSIREDSAAWRGSFASSTVYREKPYFNCFVDRAF